MPPSAPVGNVQSYDNFFKVPSGCTISSLTVRIEWARGADLDLAVAWPNNGWASAENESNSLIAPGFEEVTVMSAVPGQWYARVFGYLSTGVTYTGTVTVVAQ